MLTRPSSQSRRAPLGVDVERDVVAPMRDGVELAADVYRPQRPGRYPVILMRVPYDKTYAQTNTFEHPSWYARHGYIVVVQDTRGRYRSGGSFYPFSTEVEDGFDTVEWAAELPGSSGVVGMYGLSYAGATQLQAARSAPPSLKAICPGITSARYHEGWAYRGGAFALAFNVFWATLLAFDDARRSGDAKRATRLSAAIGNCRALCEHLPLREMPEVAAAASYFGDWLAHPTYDDYWRRWSVDEEYGRIDVPALHIGGWYDIFAGGTVRNHVGLREGAGSQAARSHQRLLIGPWHHEIQESGSALGQSAVSDRVVDRAQLRWFNQFLKEEDTGVLEAEATIFVLGAGRWREVSWPPEVERTRFYLHSGGSANSVLGDGRLSLDPPGNEVPDVFVYNPLAPVESAGGTSCCVPALTPMGPAAQCEVEILRDVLVYTSDPLERELEVIGEISASICAATTAADTDFTAKLCDVGPDGRSVNIAQGIVRGRYRRSDATAEPLTPGEVERFGIDLGPTAVVFKPGHRIRLQVSSSDFPLWDRNLNRFEDLCALGIIDAEVATQTILHDDQYRSFLELPVARG